ncbi:MAG: ferredoxin [Candidatus Woesearchaeota archaeon]|jgi:ferredoxin|nr:ferredoxin [Candidatus Woesearchaeota archaeon]
MTYKIVHDRDACIGCAACASVAPSYWSMNSDGKSDLAGSEKSGNGNEEIRKFDDGTDFDLNKEGAESCPVNCIHIIEFKEDGSENKIF